MQRFKACPAAPAHLARVTRQLLDQASSCRKPGQQQHPLDRAVSSIAFTEAVKGLEHAQHLVSSTVSGVSQSQLCCDRNRAGCGRLRRWLPTHPLELERICGKASFDNLNFVLCAFVMAFFNRRRDRVIFGVPRDTSKRPENTKKFSKVFQGQPLCIYKDSKGVQCTLG